jgi:hypothetical protein
MLPETTVTCDECGAQATFAADRADQRRDIEWWFKDHHRVVHDERKEISASTEPPMADE